MNTRERNLWIIALVVLIAGAGLLLHALLQTRTAKDRMQRRVKDLEQLQVYTDTLHQSRQARTRLAAEAPSRPERLATIAASRLDPQAFNIQRLEPQDFTPDWRLQRAELTFRNVAWNKLDDFLVQAERHRPPWILESCEIESGATGAGSGRLTLQTLEHVSK